MLNTKIKIVIVDDDPFWTSILKEILVDIGFDRIITFESGSECLKKMDSQPDIIFLDKEMEGIDGLETLELIKVKSPNTSVIFCTSKEDLSVAIAALRMGSTDFLLKSNVSKKEVTQLLEQTQIEITL